MGKNVPTLPEKYQIAIQYIQNAQNILNGHKI
jgi:hypothetical protein